MSQRKRDPRWETRLQVEVLELRCLLSVNVLTWHNDLTRQGLNSSEVVLTPADVNTNAFGELFSYNVQGQVYAQPLYVSNLTIPGQGVHNVILIATENNDVYAFDADSNSGPNGGLLWHVNLGLAAATPNSDFGSRYGAYHDITPQVGITSTPVIDLATNTIYIDAFTNDAPGLNMYSHHIHALDITTGADKVTPMLVAASVNGNGVGGNGSVVPFVAKQELQRPALTLLNGELYVCYSGYADTDPYHGWILGFDTSTLQLTSVFNTTPNLDTDANEGEGGIWMTGAGLASDGTNLFLLVGNGDFNPAVGDYGDSILKIGPDPSSSQANQNINGYGLKVVDYFTPYNQQSLADADADLGSGGAMLLPTQSGSHPNELIGGGKQGIAYVINRDNMGQYSSTTNNDLQEVNLGHGFFNSPAYFNGTVYYHAVGDVLKAYSVTNGQLSAAPVASGHSSGGGAISYSGQGATPSISSNGTSNGIVWDVQWDGNHQVLHAYDATTLTELYNSNQNVARDQLGPGVKFIVPTVADGHVFVAGSGSVAVFGLIAPPTTPPDAPSNLAAETTGATQVQLTWVDNSDNESGFKIERSTDGINFSQIAVGGAGATSYLDTTVSPSTTYDYRIRATNIIGDSDYTSAVVITTPAATGAVDIYHFDEGAGSTAADAAGINAGTLVGITHPTWVAGKIGTYALSFSGDGAYQSMTSQSAVQLANDLSPVLGGTASMTFWIKTTQTGNAQLYFAPAVTGVNVAGGTNDIRWGYLDAAGHIGMGAGDVGVVSTSVINNGQWHHVAMTRDSSTGSVKIYIDGVLQATGTSAAGQVNTPFRLIGAQTDLTIGLAPNGAAYFNGQLDDVRIYNQILSASEISGLAIVPGAPTLTSATAAPGPVVHLTWTTPSNYTQNIEIDRKVGPNGTYIAIATVGGGITMYDDTTVTRGTEYYYVVKAIDLAGTSSPSNELTVTPPVPAVVDAHILYNDSAYDGNNGSSNQTDTNATAVDKTPLLPGQTASFQNYSSYSRGLNGILIDVSDLDNLPRYEDFIFRVGNGNDPSNWAIAPIPTYVNDYPGRGPDGSTQITIIWDDNEIQNEWLQVTILANSHTGLAADYVFYYGNSIGDSGNSTTDADVNSSDVLGARGHETTNASLTNVYDYNRDKVVDAQDVTVALQHVTAGSASLQLIEAPANYSKDAAVASLVPPVVATSSEDPNGGSVLASETLISVDAAMTPPPFVDLPSYPTPFFARSYPSNATESQFKTPASAPIFKAGSDLIRLTGFSATKDQKDLELFAGFSNPVHKKSKMLEQRSHQPNFWELPIDWLSPEESI